MTFELNPTGLDELLRSAPAAAALTEIANTYKTEIERVAPRGHGSVHFAETIRVGPAHVDAGGVVVEVFTTDSFWHLIEYGSVNNPPYRPFTSAAENIGLDFKDSGRP